MTVRYAMLLLGSLVLVTACGGGSPVDQQIDLMGEATDILKGVTDKASAEAARPKLEALGKKMQAIAEELKKNPPSQEEGMEMVKKVMEAAGPLMKELQRIQAIPEVQQALGESMRGLR